LLNLFTAKTRRVLKRSSRLEVFQYNLYFLRAFAVRELKLGNACHPIEILLADPVGGGLASWLIAHRFVNVEFILSLRWILPACRIKALMRYN